MKLVFSFNEEKKGIELYFDEELNATQEQRLRALGFRKAKDIPFIGFRTEKQDSVKWYVKDHPAYREYAKSLKQALELSDPPLEDVAIYPSYQADADNIKNNHFSIATIRFKEGESHKEEQYVVFDQFVRIARDVANRYGRLKYGDRLIAVNAFSKTQKNQARLFLTQGKVIQKEDLEEHSSALKEPQTSTLQMKEEKTPLPLEASTPDVDQIIAPSKTTDADGDSGTEIVETRKEEQPTPVMDIINSKGEKVLNIWPPKGVDELYTFHQIHRENLEELKSKASSRLWELTDESLGDANAREMFELIQFGHPDHFEISVSRQALLAEWEKRGEAIFKALGFPTDMDYLYVNIHTGYGSLKTLVDVLGDRMNWWSVAEHWRPVGNIGHALPILDDLFKKLTEQMSELINPKTQKPFGKSKDEYDRLEWKESELKKSKELVESYLAKNDSSIETDSEKDKQGFSESSATKEAVREDTAPIEKPVKSPPKSSQTRDFKKLKAFADFLDQHERIDGWMAEGAIKKEFARKGKAAFKELAIYLGLENFKVTFYSGGVAVSGSLRLMGMFSENQGIHIEVTPPGIESSKVLYRSTKHLTDYSGGMNYYFPTHVFHNPPEIRKIVSQLLDLEKKENNLEPSSTEKAASTSGPVALRKFLEFIHKQDKGNEWTPKQRETFNDLGTRAFEELAIFFGLKDIEVLTYSDESDKNGTISLKGTFIDDICMNLSYGKEIKGPSYLFFDHFNSTDHGVEVLSEKILETPDILKETVIRFLKQKVRQKEKKVEVKDELEFFRSFLQWFESKDQHLPAHQITWAFFQNWCENHYPGLTKNWIDAAWELWERHTQLLAKVSSLSNGKLSPNLQRHYELLRSSGMVFKDPSDSTEKFKSWVKHTYPWFTDAKIEEIAQEKEEHDRLKKSISMDFKRKHLKRVPMQEIHLSLDRTEVDGAPGFDFSQADVFYDWKTANDYLQKVARALIPSFAVRLVWEDGLGIMVQCPTPTQNSEVKESLSDLIFEYFFDVFYNARAWPEEVSRQAGQIIEKYELYEWVDPDNTIQKDYLDQVIAQMHDLYYQGKRATPKQIEQLAKTLDVPTMGEMWEAVELSWMLWYRSIYLDSTPFENRLERMIHFWDTVQPTYTYVDSSKMLYQQYSTSCPIGAIIAEYTQMADAAHIFEPSAGNGLLVLGADPKKTHVNEIDISRLKSLKFQGFEKITELDATQPFPEEWTKRYDVVVTNPPFTQWVDDKWDKEYLIDKYFHGQIGLAKHIRLEHLMAGLALHTLKDDGKAAIIIMGHMYFKDGLIAKYRPFFNWLYRHYYVEDIINLNSYKLYNKQGAVAQTMLILINGRKPKPEGVAPKEIQAPQISEVVDSFQDLWRRVKSLQSPTSSPDRLDLLLQQLKIELS